MTCLQSHPDIFFFSLPTNQMAVRFQTQGSGRQSRNKIAFLGRRIGLTICQIKGPTHTHIHTNKRLFWLCVSSCVSKRVPVFRCWRYLWGGEVMYRSVSEHPWWNTALLLRSTAQTLPRRLIQGLMNVWLVYYPKPGEDIHPPVSRIQIFLWVWHFSYSLRQPRGFTLSRRAELHLQCCHLAVGQFYRMRCF